MPTRRPLLNLSPIHTAAGSLVLAGRRWHHREAVPWTLGCTLAWGKAGMCTNNPKLEWVKERLVTGGGVIYRVWGRHLFSVYRVYRQRKACVSGCIGKKYIYRCASANILKKNFSIQKIRLLSFDTKQIFTFLAVDDMTHGNPSPGVRHLLDDTEAD